MGYTVEIERMAYGADAIAHDAAGKGRSDAAEEHEGGGVGAVELHRQRSAGGCRGIGGIPVAGGFVATPSTGLARLAGILLSAVVRTPGTIYGILYFLQKSLRLELHGVGLRAVFLLGGRKKFDGDNDG